jgi:acetyltransferase
MSQPLMTSPERAVRREGTPEGGRALDAIFAARSVAVVGASERPGSVGRVILDNLLARPFLRSVYPVASQQPGILDLRPYPRIADVPEPIDLAVIVTPAPLVHDIVVQCIDAGVRGAIVTTAGFREAGPDGVEWEREILAEARRGGMRLLGPNSFGVVCPFLGLNATPTDAMAHPGHIAFLSQSSSMCSAVLDWILYEKIGISALVSVGAMLDIGWGDLIDHFGDDPDTRSIIIHMSSIDDPRSFLAAARAVAPTKPIIVLKAGRAEDSAEGDEVLDAAFRRCGVLRVRRLSDLFDMAEVLGQEPRPRGTRLTIVTNGGGPGVLAADALLASGGELATLSPETVAALDALLPAHWSRGNPIDLLDDADPDRFVRAVECVTADPNTDGLLVILTPLPMADPTVTAERLRHLAHFGGKPILASWMGGTKVLAGATLLSRAGICTFDHPDTAACAFRYLGKYSNDLLVLEEQEISAAPVGDDDAPTPDLETAAAIARAVRRSGRTVLDEVESLRLLATYGLPTVPTFAAARAEAAVSLAEEIGTPVSLRPLSDPRAPRDSARGVSLDLASAEAVRLAYAALEAAARREAGPDHFRGVTVQPGIDPGGYQLIAGSRIDPQFGPVLVFGFGGQLTEVFNDRAFGLPPLTLVLARRMMECTRIYQALTGRHGRAPVNLAALERFLVRLGQLVIEQPWIKQIDINPLYVTSERLLALDARVVAWGPEIPEDQRPRPVLGPNPALEPVAARRDFGAGPFRCC